MDTIFEDVMDLRLVNLPLICGIVQDIGSLRTTKARTWLPAVIHCDMSAKRICSKELERRVVEIAGKVLDNVPAHVVQ